MDDGVSLDQPVARAGHQFGPRDHGLRVEPARERRRQNDGHALFRLKGALHHGRPTLLIAQMGGVGDDNAARHVRREAADRLSDHAAHGAADDEGRRLADGAQQFDDVGREVVETKAAGGGVAVAVAAEIGSYQATLAFKLGDDAIPEGAAHPDRMHQHDRPSSASGAIGDRQAIAQSETHGQPFGRGRERRAGLIRPPGGMS